MEKIFYQAPKTVIVELKHQNHLLAMSDPTSDPNNPERD